jgi:hypothetical protein
MRKLKSTQKLLYVIASSAFFTALFLGGIGREEVLVTIHGVVVGLLLLTTSALTTKKIKLPNNFRLFLIFLSFTGLNLFWTGDKEATLKILALYISFAIYWLASFNFKQTIWLKHVIVGIGLIFATLFFLRIADYIPETITPRGFISQASHYNNHAHLGDYWAIVIIFLIPSLLKKITYTGFLLTGLGVFILAFSESRSAYLALLIGISYIASQQKLVKKHSKTIIFSLATITVLVFLSVGFSKTLLGSRPYFVQSIAGFFKYPLGVGVGNFDAISNDPATHWFGFSGFSIVTHNIVLEFISGMGVLGFVFAWWLYKIIVDLIKDSSKKNLVYRAAFIGITVIFMFDTVYLLPTMVWLWGILLGLSQSRTKS